MADKRKLSQTDKDELTTIMRKDPNGLLHIQQIIQVAQAPSNPLHKYFTWRDDEAAEKWREEEARQLIQSYTVYSQEADITVRALTSLESDRQLGGGYRWTLEVVERPDLRPQMLETALRELKQIENRYRHIEQLVRVWDSIEAAQATRGAK